MRKKGMNFLITLGVLTIALVSLAYGGETSMTSLPLLIEEALKNNPQIKASHEKLKAAQFRIVQASSLPDPTATYNYMGRDIETRIGPQEDLYEFEQMIPSPGKLRQRTRIATEEKNMLEAQFKATEREVVYRLSESYFDLVAADKTIQLTEGIVEALKKAESIAQSRFASMAISQREVAGAQAEVSKTLQELFMYRQQRQSLVAFINSLLNRSQETPLENFEELSLPQGPLELDELIERLRKDNPTIQEASFMKKREGHALSLAKYENAPDFSVGFQYSRIGEGMTSEADDGRDAWMIPVKVTLPIWRNRIDSAIHEAKSNLLAGESQLKEIENAIEYELKNTYYQFVSQKQIVDLHQNALIPQAQIAFNSDKAGYEAGNTDIFHLIESERLLFNAQVSYYQVLANALKSHAALERMVGDISFKGGKQ